MKKNTIANWLVFAVLAAGTIVAFVFGDAIFGEGSVFQNTVSSSGTLQTFYGKIPALIRSVQIVTIAILASVVIRFVLGRLFRNSKRGLTIVRLINSFLTWVIAIVAVLLILGAWGVDTGTLLASAGILSLIIGLGAQSLIADIIAGLFIVVEGEYQIGDIIIDDWRGTV